MSETSVARASDAIKLTQGSTSWAGKDDSVLSEGKTFDSDKSGKCIK